LEAVIFFFFSTINVLEFERVCYFAMCDLSEFPLDISNEDELRAAYSALRVTIGTLIENIAVCIFCIFFAYVDW
jgi:hypothetical protein